jgi:hypothetical protein
MDQVRAYPGLRVDVANDVDHVLEGGLCVSDRDREQRKQDRSHFNSVRRKNPFLEKFRQG